MNHEERTVAFPLLIIADLNLDQRKVLVTD